MPGGDGANAEMPPRGLPHFALVAGTRRTGLLSAPFLSRFGIVLRLEYYSPLELTEIVRRSARKLGVTIEDGGAEEIGRRARGTPRIANHLLKRVRDFAEVENDGRVTAAVASSALRRLGGDELCLDGLDRTLLRCIIPSRAATRSASSSMADHRISLGRRCSSSLLMSVTSAGPPRPGIITSMTTTSGRSRTIVADTPNGVAQVSTSCPRCCSSLDIMAKT